MKNYKAYSIVFVAFMIFLVSCGGESRFEKSPVDEIISKRELINKAKPFSIILYDMDIDDSRGVYKHKYQIKEDISDSTKKPEITEWVDVSERFAGANIDNMGMELASMNDQGKMNKIPSPPGYNNVVGNSKYGQWKTDSNGNSFWAFYGQYMFMSNMFHMATTPVYRSSYRGYTRHRSAYPNKAYYGSGRNAYGTKSPASRRMNPNFHAKRSANATAFKSKVSSNPSRYSRRSNRSIGRSRGSSYRSRGGGYGK